MDFDKLYKMQEELNQHIWDKHGTLDKMSKEELLDSTILALLVEVGELANTTKCFKHWSTKGMMDKEIVLEELADCLHFYFSIGNQVGEKYSGGGLKDNIKAVSEYELSEVFINIYYLTSVIGMHLQDLEYHYSNIGIGLEIVAYLLNFTDKEVEQAYLKKHEENYKRQRGVGNDDENKTFKREFRAI